MSVGFLLLIVLVGFLVLGGLAVVGSALSPTARDNGMNCKQPQYIVGGIK